MVLAGHAEPGIVASGYANSSDVSLTLLLKSVKRHLPRTFRSQIDLLEEG